MSALGTVAGVVGVFAFAALCLWLGMRAECWAARPCARCGGSGKEPVE